MHHISQVNTRTWAGTNVNFGHTVENLVESLCTKSFFADFTFRSPRYKKYNGQEKEAADLVVVFGGTLLAIQVKTRAVDMLCGQISQVDEARLSRKLEATVRQFRALAEALNSPAFTSFENVRGVTVKFDKKKLTDIVLVIVFEATSTDDPERPVKIDAPFLQDGDIPVHLFNLNEFSLLLTLADTLPDFLLYLEARSALHREKLIAPSTDPFDEWAFITFERRAAAEALVNRSFVDLAGCGSRHRASVERLEKKEKLSYFIDRLIEALNLSIGSQIPVHPKFVCLEDANSVGAYQTVIPHLAKLSRSQRGQLVEFLLNRVRACRHKELSFRCFKFSERSSEGFVVLASKAERKARQAALHNILSAAAFKLEATTLLGVAVAHDWPNSESCDLMVMEASRLEADGNLKTTSEKILGRPRTSSRKRKRWVK